MVSTFKSTKTFKLSNGAEIPALGLGTWQASENEGIISVLEALKEGYRHIDTALGYQNEVEVGKAIVASGIPRDEIFITTKLANTRHRDPERALNESLERLGLEYVDLYLMHWPMPLNPHGNHPFFPTRQDGSRDIDVDWNFIKTYELLQKCVESGKAKAIGVSNFSIKRLQELLSSDILKYKPVVNQVESHPYLPQHKLLEYCTKNDIIIEAYSPLGSTGSPLFKDPTLLEIASKYDVSTATIMISWQIWRNVVVLPKSIRPDRIASNLQIVQLSDEDGKIINDISTKRGGTTRFINPKWAPGYVVFNDDE